MQKIHCKGVTSAPSQPKPTHSHCRLYDYLNPLENYNIKVTKSEFERGRKNLFFFSGNKSSPLTCVVTLHLYIAVIFQSNLEIASDQMTLPQLLFGCWAGLFNGLFIGATRIPYNFSPAPADVIRIKQSMIKGSTIGLVLGLGLGCALTYFPSPIRGNSTN